MTLQYLLDTNVISEPIRPDPDSGLLARLKKHDNEVAIAAVVWHELCFGALRLPRGRKRRLLVEYLETVVRASLPIVDYDETAASIHADRRARLANRGKTPSFVDGQIAATAIANDLTLVTSNTSHFKVFEGLAIEDWCSSRRK